MLKTGCLYRIDPVQPGISYKGIHSTVRRVEERNGVLLHVACIALDRTRISKYVALNNAYRDK